MPPPAVAGQVAVAIGRASDDKLEIRLDPPELGRVQIQLTRHDGGIQAVVMADRPETQDLLRRHAEVLVRELGQAGYDSVSLDFAGGEARAGRDDARSLDWAQAAPAAPAAAGRRRRPPPGAAAPPAGSTSASDPRKEPGMEINPTTTTGAAGAPKTGASDGPRGRDAAGAVTGDFQTFLTLLTTQMRNQDPLKPMDSTEFVAQLASFSAVEQQIRSTSGCRASSTCSSGGSPAGLAEWIGREVRVAAKADFAGAPVEVAVAPAEGADKAVLVVENDFGQRGGAPARRGRRHRGDLGRQGRDGRHGRAGELWVHARELRRRHADRHERGQGLRRVQEVRVVDGAPVLVVDGGAQVPLDEVGGVR